jgi:hypothetical protein
MLTSTIKALDIIKKAIGDKICIDAENIRLFIKI